LRTLALGKAGVSVADLKKIAGPDGRIKSPEEFGGLFGLVDAFDGKALLPIEWVV
jgi:hypothetical protein